VSASKPAGSFQRRLLIHLPSQRAKCLHSERRLGGHLGRVEPRGPWLWFGSFEIASARASVRSVCGVRTSVFDAGPKERQSHRAETHSAGGQRSFSR